MNAIGRYGILGLIFMGMWVILNEKAGPTVFLSGLVFSAVALFVTDFFLLEDRYARRYSLRPITVLRYLFVLLFQIYKSGFSAIPKIIKGNSNIQIAVYQSRLTDELAVCLLANSITLTPGTVTLEKNKDQLKVLAFLEEDSMGSRPLDFKEFESILKELRP